MQNKTYTFSLTDGSSNTIASNSVLWMQSDRVQSIEKQVIDIFTDDVSDVLAVFKNLFEITTTDSETFYLNANNVIDVKSQSYGCIIIYPNRNFETASSLSAIVALINAAGIKGADYSATETIVGTFLGDPLYAKVITIPTTGANSTEIIDVASLDIAILVRSSSIFKIADAFNTSNQQSNNNDVNWGYYFTISLTNDEGTDGDTMYANFNVGTKSSDYDYRYALIEYTKTTD